MMPFPLKNDKRSVAALRAKRQSGQAMRLGSVNTKPADGSPWDDRTHGNATRMPSVGLAGSICFHVNLGGLQHFARLIVLHESNHAQVLQPQRTLLVQQWAILALVERV